MRYSFRKIFLIQLVAPVSLFVFAACGSQESPRLPQVNTALSEITSIEGNSDEDSVSQLNAYQGESSGIDSVPFWMPGDTRSDFSENDAPSFFGSYAWPARSKTITSKYGKRSSPCQGCSSFHKGVDIGIGSGSDVFAANSGSVSGLWDSCAGNMMRVTKDNVQTRYFHLSSFLAAGKVVNSGNLIAKSGNTGSCTPGAHLHFEFWVNGQHKNPLNYVK